MKKLFLLFRRGHPDFDRCFRAIHRRDHHRNRPRGSRSDRAAIPDQDQILRHRASPPSGDDEGKDHRRRNRSKRCRARSRSGRLGPVPHEVSLRLLRRTRDAGRPWLAHGRPGNRLIKLIDPGVGGRLERRPPSPGVENMKSHREARIAGLSLAAVYAMCPRRYRNQHELRRCRGLRCKNLVPGGSSGREKSWRSANPARMVSQNHNPALACAGTGTPAFVKAHFAGPARSSGHGNDVAADRLRGRHCLLQLQAGPQATRPAACWRTCAACASCWTPRCSA